MAGKAQTVEGYLAGLPDAQREALEKLRGQVRSVVPGATEEIWYGMPTFKLDGKALVSYRAAPKHCAFHVMSPKLMEACAEALDGLDWSGGTVRFRPEQGLPTKVVKTLVKERIKELGPASGLRRVRRAP